MARTDTQVKQLIFHALNSRSRVRGETRKERFLIKMDQVVPWKGLINLIEPHYPKDENGRGAPVMRKNALEGCCSKETR